MGRAFYLALAFFGVGCQAAIIDRIAVSVGNQVITEDQILDDIRITAFLNHGQPDFGTQGRKEAADRLIEQTLIRREMEFSHYNVPELAEAKPLLDQLQAAYPSRGAFDAALSRAGITADELLRHLWWQLTIMWFIDERFRPAVQIPESEVRDFYQRKVSEWKQAGQQVIPTFDQSRASLEKALTEQRVNQALDRWLNDTRTQIDIRFRKEAFQS